MMETVDYTLKTLMANAWQENLNVWTFREKVIQIRSYATPDVARFIEFSLQQTIDDKLILRTRKEFLGDLYLRINTENTLPRIHLSRVDSHGHDFQLQYFVEFTAGQKAIIESRLSSLENFYSTKEKEIIQNIVQHSNTHHIERIKTIELELGKIETEIGRLVMVVKTTMNIASNFHAYYNQLEADILKLEEKIKTIE